MWIARSFRKNRWPNQEMAFPKCKLPLTKSSCPINFPSITYSLSPNLFPRDLPIALYRLWDTDLIWLSWIASPLIERQKYLTARSWFISRDVCLLFSPERWKLKFRLSCRRFSCSCSRQHIDVRINSAQRQSIPNEILIVDKILEQIFARFTKYLNRKYLLGAEQEQFIRTMLSVSLSTDVDLWLSVPFCGLFVLRVPKMVNKLLSSVSGHSWNTIFTISSLSIKNILSTLQLVRSIRQSRMMNVLGRTHELLRSPMLIKSSPREH